MPRRARLHAPGTLYHVIVQGIEKRRIVSDVADHKDFVQRLGELSTATKTAVQIGPLAGVGFQGALDEREGLVEADDELGSDHVVPQRLLGPADAFREAQDEIPLMDALRNIEDFVDGGHVRDYRPSGGDRSSGSF